MSSIPTLILLSSRRAPRRSRDDTRERIDTMNALRLSVAGLFLLGLCSVVTAEEKKDDNKTLIVGSWELTKGESLPPGATLEFTKDGKMKLVLEPEKGKKLTIEGTYEVKGDSLLATMKDPEGKEHKEKRWCLSTHATSCSELGFSVLCSCALPLPPPGVTLIKLL